MNVGDVVVLVVGGLLITFGICSARKIMKDYDRSIGTEEKSTAFYKGWLQGRLAADKEVREYMKEHKPDLYESIMNYKP